MYCRFTCETPHHYSSNCRAHSDRSGMSGKKKAGSVGGKKKKVGKVPLPLVIPTDINLPPITSVKCATLQNSVISNDLRSLERLVAHYDFGSNLREVDANGSTLLHTAVKRRDNAMLIRLLEYQAIPLNATEYPLIGGRTALHHACAVNDVKAVQLLLHAGASPNTKCNNSVGETPLMTCCKEGNIACARHLLDYGASLELKDNFGNNASFWASEHRQHVMMRELNMPLAHTATVNEFVNLLRQRIPNFVLPTIKDKKKKKDSKGKKKK